ncbi:MAG: vWA domain-containing protein [Nocardioides sp.]
MCVLNRILAVLAVVATTCFAAVVPAAAPAVADDGSGTTYSRMLLVLDSSGSMSEPAAGGVSKIKAARAALDQVVGDLPEGAQVGMRVFGATVFSKSQRGACIDTQLVVRPGTGNRNQLRQAISSYKPYGETPIAYALKQAARDIGSEGSRSIVLVSDGLATCPPDPCVVARQIAQRGIDLKIDVVGLDVSGRAQQQLRCIAEKGHGTYYGVDSAGDIVQSLSHVAQRDARPFTLEGTPIKGSRDPNDPTPVTAGIWTDTLPAHQENQDGDALSYTFTRTMPGSTVHISAVSTGDPGAGDSIEAELKAPDGTVCDSDNDYRDINRSSVLGAEVLSQSPEDTESSCATSPTLLVTVARSIDATKPAAPLELLVAEEPPVGDLAHLPGPVNSADVKTHPPTPGPAEPVTGGTSFPDATAVSAGTYSASTVPGETQVYKVHLDWGQRLSVAFRFPAGTPSLQRLTGAEGPYANVRVFDPLRAPLSDLVGDSDTTGFSTGVNPDRIGAETFPVRYRNRGVTATVSTLPGDYYVEIGVSPDIDGDTYVLPYQMDVSVIGALSGAPTYTGDSGWQVSDALAANASPAGSDPGAGPTDSGSSTGAEQSAGSGRAAPAASRSGSTTKYVVAGGLGAVALVCAGVGVALIRRVR